jgi:1,4-dihydroxy-2-naphthoate octaprenyltransferase
MLATAILVVNNLRDRHTDAVANKRTLAVRWGGDAARIEHGAMIAGAYLLVIAGALCSWVPWPSTIGALCTLPLAISEIKAVRLKDGADLNPHLGGAARLELVFSLLFGLGFLL